MVELSVFLIFALALLVLGVIGSVVPILPGALLSVIGVWVYWWSTGFADPSLVFVLAVTVIGAFTFLLDYFAGAISAKAGGASTATMIVAAVVGALLFFVTGPVGIVLGIAGTVFVVELVSTRDVGKGIRASVYATVGVLASSLVQVLITAGILVAFVVAVIL